MGSDGSDVSLEEDLTSSDELGAKPKQVKLKTQPAQPAEVKPRITGDSAMPCTKPKEETELTSILKDFLLIQKQREDILINELREIKTAMSVPSTNIAQHSVNTPSTEESLHMQLPTPAPRSPPHNLTTPNILAVQSHDSVEPVVYSDLLFHQDPKMLPFAQGEDIENFLVRFKHMARTWGWPFSDWACRLVPLLTGKAFEAYSAMDEQASNSYPALKDALLAKFDICPETYRLQFRSLQIPPGESPRETYDRLKGLYRRWMKPEQRSKEEIAEVIILEQLLHMLPAEMKTWIKEHEPEDGLIAAKLAGQYLNACKGMRPARKLNPKESARWTSDGVDQPSFKGPDHKQGGQGVFRPAKGQSE
ncbi:uncharacterized protein LOC125897838 [Epinephelus fuscoguttatus]|uniref:uncharacterized protein LOC125897838 n=1 Tax=Epinephelus fuscoguttatus TaxID=293821 RepID=UPI0020D1D938|nr:uncharacterized protein LOC125897838 [Epinephelus fuscoguttatus]